MCGESSRLRHQLLAGYCYEVGRCFWHKVKPLFFEKKEPKNFLSWGTRDMGGARGGIK